MSVACHKTRINGKSLINKITSSESDAYCIRASAYYIKSPVKRSCSPDWRTTCPGRVKLHSEGNSHIMQRHKCITGAIVSHAVILRLEHLAESTFFVLHKEQVSQPRAARGKSAAVTRAAPHEFLSFHFEDPVPRG